MTNFAGRTIKLNKDSFVRAARNTKRSGDVLYARAQDMLDFAFSYYAETNNPLYLSLTLDTIRVTHGIPEKAALAYIKSIANVELGENKLGEPIFKMEKNAELATINDTNASEKLVDFKLPKAKPSAKSAKQLATKLLKDLDTSDISVTDFLRELQSQIDNAERVAESQASEKVEAELEEANAIPTIGAIAA